MKPALGGASARTRMPSKSICRSGTLSLAAVKSFDPEYETEWDDAFGANVRSIKLLTFREAVQPPSPRKRRPAKKRAAKSLRKKQPKRAR